MGDDVLALSLKGKSIDHVAAFNTHNGEWSQQHLLLPVEDEIHPVRRTDAARACEAGGN
ncbi:MAG: hypothetical protein ACLQGP_36595 [Isosphaeraceae bacterium]